MYARDEFDENEDDLRGTLADRLRGQYAQEPTPPLGEAGAGTAGQQPIEAAPFNEAPTGGTGQEQTYQPQVEPDRSETPMAQPQGPLPYSATLPQGNSPAELAALNQALGFGGGGQGAPPSGTQDPVAFIREWQQSHPSSEGPGPLFQALQQRFGIGRFMYGQTPSGNEANYQGGPYKVYSEGSGQWYRPGMDDSGPAAPMAQQGLTNYQPRAQAYTPFSIGGVTAPQGLWGSDFTSQLRQILMARLAAAGRPVDPNDPGITEPLTAARDEATRGTEAERAKLAERAYAQGGLNTDVIGRQIQQSNERNAVGLGTLRANLITREIDSRKSELQQLLQMAFASGDAEASREIQMQIAQLNAMLQQEGFQVQREGIGANLAINAANQNANTLRY